MDKKYGAELKWILYLMLIFTAFQISICSKIDKLIEQTDTTCVSLPYISPQYRESTLPQVNIPQDTKVAEMPFKIENTAEQEKTYLGEFTITHYCHCTKCNGKWAGQATASGVMPTAGQTIAVDKEVIPLGTAVEINGKQYIAEDTGGAIKGNKIDIFVESHEQALELGIFKADVYTK